MKFLFFVNFILYRAGLGWGDGTWESEIRTFTINYRSQMDTEQISGKCKGV